MPAVKGQEIRRRRQRLGLKVPAFAAVAGVNAKTLANIEAGEGQVVSIEAIHRIARALGMDAEDLLAEADAA
jgi:transcriptional regulator with XRE-family HTH domain